LARFSYSFTFRAPGRAIWEVAAHKMLAAAVGNAAPAPWFRSVGAIRVTPTGRVLTLMTLMLVAKWSPRRYTRLSNGLSRKIENHMAAVALNYFADNFIKIHTTLRTSPAMAAGVTTRLFDVSDLMAVLVEWNRKKRRSR